MFICSECSDNDMKLGQEVQDLIGLIMNGELMVSFQDGNVK